jgi:hypothetical protein
LKSIYNFIAYSKIKKVLKNIGTKCQGRKKLKGLFRIFAGAGAKLKEERENKKKIIVMTNR